MENKNSNESREMTQEELDQILGGYVSSTSRPKAQQQYPSGIACPRCGGNITLSLRQVLLDKRLYCPICGLNLSIEKDHYDRARKILAELDDKSHRF